MESTGEITFISSSGTMSIPPSTAADPVPPSETISGLAISLTFYFCLLSSATLFAIVAISPKFMSHLQLRYQFDSNQLQQVALERQTEKLKRVIRAMRTDKEFANEMTRIEFDAVRPGEEVIPVDPSLELDTQLVSDAHEVITPPAVWYEPFVRFVASDNTTRWALLGVAAAIIVIGFTILPPASSESRTGAGRGGPTIWQSFTNRYVRQDV